MKKKIIFTTLICLSFIIAFLIGLTFINETKGNYSTSDIPFTFESESYYNSVNPSYNYTLNVRNQTLFTQDYNATYSFENDIIGSKPKYWNIFDIGGHAKIIKNKNNHNNVLEILDNSSSQSVYMYNNFLVQTNSIIEFYWCFNSTETIEHYLRLYLMENMEEKIYILFNYKEGNLGTIVSLDNTYSYNDISINQSINSWYHIKIELNDILNSFIFYLNGINRGSFDYFSDTNIGIDSLRFYTKTSNSGGFYWHWLDAIGYSWDDNYTIGQNIIPYQEINPNIKEVDKYEFAFKSFQDLNDIGSSNCNSWIDVDNVDNLVRIATDTTNDRVISMSGQLGYPYEMGIYREFDIPSGVLNITWNIEIGNFGQTNNEVGIYIYSYDDIELTYIFIENGYLKYDNSIKDIILDSGLTNSQNYEFNLYINTYDNMMVLKYYENEIYQDTFFLSLQISNKHGLGKIEFLKDHKVGSISVCELDYIGIYVNGSSISTEFGIIKNYDMIYTTPMLYFTYSNLFSFTIDNTNMSLKISEYPYIDFNDIITEICSLDIYEGFNRFNHYDTNHDGNDYINATILWIQFYNQLELSKINIEGVRLTYELYEYGSWLRYTHNGIDIQENYFYENNNKLYFTHNSNQSDVLEYIQAEFLIQTILTTNRSIGFNSYFIGTSHAIFKVRFHGNTYNQFDFSIGTSKFNTILTQKKNLYSFVILITDNNDNNITGNSEGYTTDIKLTYYPNIELTILTLSLIEIMIPLIIIIVPTVAIASVYGKKAILPMLMLMSIICFATNIIPIEIFFIIIITLGCGMFLEYKKEREKI